MDAALIQRLIAMGRHSLLQYVADSCPWTDDKTRGEFADVLALAEEERAAIGRLIRFLQKKHIRPLVLGSFPAHFTLMNFVTVDFLVPKLIEENENQIAEIEKCLAAANHEDVRAAIEQYLEVKQRHLQSLKDAQATAADRGRRPVKRFRTWTLTDVVNDVWLDNFSTGSDRLQLGTAQNWSLRKRTLRGGLRDGIDLIEVHNGALSYSILPTRGMGLWQGRYRGINLGWKAPVHGPVHPGHVNSADRGGIGWLTGFDEWLCRCGLSSNGPPGEDVYTDRHGQPRRDQLTLHGRIANQPAYYVELRVGLDPPYELSVTGQVEEGGLFYPHLVLTTSYSTIPGSNRLVIHDHVENRGADIAEMQLLYHCNMGQPLLEAGSRVALPIREVSPISARAAEGIDTLETYAGPVAGFTEQVYCCDLLGDAAGRTLAMLYNHTAEVGCVLRFNRQELPCFTIWKNTGALEDGYVTGLEPATNYPNFKTFERQHGRVVQLPAGGHWETTWSIEVHDSSAGVAGVLAEIVSLQSQAKAIVHRAPHPKFAAAIS